MAAELTKRVGVAVVGIPVAILLLRVGGWPLAVVLAAVAAGGALEFYRLAGQRGVHAFAGAGALLSAVLVLLPVLPLPAAPGGWAWHVTVAASLAVAAAAIFLRGVDGAPLQVSAATVFGALLTGGTLAYALLLYRLPVPAFNGGTSAWIGPALLAFPMTLTWMSDTFAYFGGRAWGRTKLIPSVSPGKTVQGAVSGVLGCVVVGALYARFIFDAGLGVPMSMATGALIGFVVSPVAQLGDLAESLLKREAGVKDSGALLPGHGGILDRFDALLFTIPVTYALLLLVF